MGIRRAPVLPLSAASAVGVPEVERVGGRVVGAAVAALVDAPTRGSLADIPFTNMAEAPQDVVISRKDGGGGWADVTAAAFAAEVSGVAKGLIAAGMEPGDRLGIMARTSYAWTLLDFAGWAASLITVPIYPTSSAEQTAWILADSGAAGCVVEEPAQERLVSGRQGELPGLRQLWRLDAG